MIRVDLLKPEKRELKEVASPLIEELREKKKFPTYIFIIVLAAVIALFMVYNQRNAMSLEQEFLESAREEKSQLKDVIVKLDQLEKQKLLFEKKINIIRLSKTSQEIAVKVMDELSRNIPGWAWLTEVSYKNQIVRIKGKALSNELIADYIYNLETSPYLYDIKLIGSTQRRVRNNQIQEFSLTARYLLQSLLDPSSEETSNKEKK